MKKNHLFYTSLLLACIGVYGCDDSSNHENVKTCPSNQTLNADTGNCEDIKAPECTEDKDCGDGKICKDGICKDISVTMPECTENKDCTDDKECLDGSCKTVECTDNSKCSDKQICKDYQCIDVDCTIDDQCENGTCVQNKCQENVECNEDSDCEDNRKCINHTCIELVECINNDQCKDGKVCENNRCIEAECSDNSQCENGLICNNGNCVEEKQCSDNSQCENGLVCNNGNCVEEKQCSDNSQCENGLVCNNGNCVEAPKTPCTNTSECTNQLCIEGFCTDAESCTNTSNCHEGFYCIAGKCSEAEDCTKIEDCSENLLCIQNKCIEPPVCTSNEECPESLACNDGKCGIDPLICETDFDCPKDSGLSCVNNYCVDPSIKCTQDSECTNDLICQNGQCVPECQKSTDCSDNKVCKKNKCQFECINSDECGELKYCKANRCTADCTEDSDCPDKSICKSNICSYECRNNNDCSDSKVCAEHQCVECADSSQCPGDEVCVQNTCKTNHDIRYPCIQMEDQFTTYYVGDTYEPARNPDGSVNLCRLGYLPSVTERENGAREVCVPVYTKRSWDFYGDGIDSNCDGYDYDLSTAIFVYPEQQGMLSGNDNNNGQYDETSDTIKPVLTLKKAMGMNHILLMDNSGKPHEIYPDILVSRSLSNVMTAPLMIPTNAANDIQNLTKLEVLDSQTYQTAYDFHMAMIQKGKEDNTFSANQYSYIDETTFPKSYIRIFGGFEKVGSETTYDWRNEDKGYTVQNWNIQSLENDYYVAIQPQVTTRPLSAAIHNMKFSLKAQKSIHPETSTLIGLSCGKAGCSDLSLKNFQMDVTAPDGIDITGTLTAGANGSNGKNGYTKLDKDISASAELMAGVCPKAQTCGGQAGGTGGCAGYGLTIKEKTTSESDVEGELMGKAGADGATTSAGLTGGNGGEGLLVSVAYEKCGDNDTVDPTKGTGAQGEDGQNGQNGSNEGIKLNYTNLLDNVAIGFTSQYATAPGLHGQDGSQGGGGGGGSVYQIYRNTLTDLAWVNAGTGGNGGCGGQGGKAGGTGGSAIGALIIPPAKDHAEIEMDNAQFNVTAGNGGIGQNGSNGGRGGKAGESIGYASKSLTGSTHCQKATAGGDGGLGGGGGAGAGGAAGKAVTYLLVCNRNATDNCANETPQKPCFVADNRASFSNCGINLPVKLIANYGDSDFGSVTAGSFRNNAETSSVTGQGATASTEMGRKGENKFIETYITTFTP